MPFIDVFFDEFLPDLGGAPHNERIGYLVEANQVRRTPGGYRPIHAATTVASAATLPGTAGATADAFGGQSPNNVSFDIFFASPTQIYQTDDKGQSWSTISQSIYSGTRWDWARYDDHVIAFGNQDTPQSKTLGATTSGLMSDLSADISGVTPQTGDRVRDHLVIATRTGVRYSAIGDPTSFPTPGSATAIANQAGAQSLPAELGQVRKVSGGEKFGLIWQDKGITRMTYRGTIGTVFEFDTFEIGQGLTYSANSNTESVVDVVVRANNLYYFLNENGVFVTDGYRLTNLSAGKIETSLFKDFLGHSKGAFGGGLAGVYDEKNQEIIWKSQASSSHYGLVYSLITQSFSTVTTNDSKPLFVAKESATSYTSRVYERNSSGLLVEWNQSTSIPIVMQTAYMELKPGRRIQLEGAHLLGSQHSTPTLAYKVADDYANVDIATSGYTTMTSPARDIKFTARDTGRFLSFRVTGNQDAKSLLQGLRVYYNIMQSK